MKILHSQFTAKPGHEDEVAEMICGFADKVRTFNDRLEEIIEEPHSVLTFIDQIA